MTEKKSKSRQVLARVADGMREWRRSVAELDDKVKSSSMIKRYKNKNKVGRETERPGEGRSSLHGRISPHGGAGTPNEGNLGHASNTKGSLRRKTCTPKTAMTLVVATIS